MRDHDLFFDEEVELCRQEDRDEDEHELILANERILQWFDFDSRLNLRLCFSFSSISKILFILF